MDRLSLIALVQANLEVLIAHDAQRRGGIPLRHDEIALKAGVGKGTVGRISRGDVAPRIDSLEAVAGAFGLRAWQMLTGPLNMQEKPELMTHKVRQELEELRALRAQVEAWSRGNRPTGPASHGHGTSSYSEDSGGE